MYLEPDSFGCILDYWLQCRSMVWSGFDELVDLEKGRLRVLFDWGFGNGDMSEIRKEFQRIVSENYKLNERSD